MTVTIGRRELLAALGGAAARARPCRATPGCPGARNFFLGFHHGTNGRDRQRRRRPFRACRRREDCEAPPGTAQARTWVSLEPGWRVLDQGGALVVEHNGVRVQ